MNQVVGLIEIDAERTTAACDFPEAWDDATLEGLFARLIAPDEREVRESRNQTASDSTTMVCANLEDLAQDLRLATRQVLAEIFLGLGGRR